MRFIAAIVVMLSVCLASSLALAAQQKAKPDQAKPDQVKPDQAKLRRHLAVLYTRRARGLYHRGQMNQAVNQLEKALAVDPDFEPARRNWRRLQTRDVGAKPRPGHE